VNEALAADVTERGVNRSDDELIGELQYSTEVGKINRTKVGESERRKKSQ